MIRGLHVVAWPAGSKWRTRRLQGDRADSGSTGNLEESVRSRFTRSRATRTVVALAVLAGTLAAFNPPASATHDEQSLAGSQFEIDTDANLKRDDDAPSIDWASVTETRKADTASGSGDESFGKGTDENEDEPVIVDGSIPPNKSDLKFFGLYQEGATSTGFLTLFWSRVQAPQGTTNMDFELNQRRCTAGLTPADPDCAPNGITPIRSVGDKLITYDLSQGGTVPGLSLRSWTGTVWGDAADLDASGDARGSVNTSTILAADSDGLGAQDPFTFGEAHIKMSALFTGITGCMGLGSAYLKSRASDSFTSALKDFVPPEAVNITSCGQVTIHKADDAGNALNGVEFELYVNNVPLTAPRGTPAADPLTNPRLSCTTAGNGDCTINNVPFGDYWVHEVAPPTGYTAAPDQALNVAASGNTPTGTLTFTNTRNPASVTLHKQDDAGVALSGATFTLYNDAAPTGGTRGAEDTVVNPGKSCTTNASGDCTISGILPVGNFWLVETGIPSGHTGAADRAITLTLGQSLDISGTPFVNNRQFRVITFVCVDSTDTLYGAKVSYDAAAAPASPNTPVVGGDITSGVESAICGLSGTAVHSGGTGSHSSAVVIE
jgi:hypothetical protein